MDQVPDLAQMIRRLYTTFSRYTRPLTMGTDGLPVIPFERGPDAALLLKPLECLTCEDFARYASDAMTTM